MHKPKREYHSNITYFLRTAGWRWVLDAPSLLLMSCIGLSGVSTQASAGVEVRIESKPMDQPIDAYVLVKDGSTPVPGLAAQDFQVMLDGVPLEQFEFALSPREDPAQRVSVVIVARAERDTPPGAHPDHLALLNRLKRGDYVSVVRLWDDFENRRWGKLTFLPFTRLDNGPQSQAVADFLQAPEPTRNLTGPKGLLYGLRRGLREFEAPNAPLPDGPKAIVTITAGASSLSSYSLSDVIGAANDIGIPIFNAGHAGWNRLYPHLDAASKALAKDTGGIRVLLEREERDDLALAKIAKWLEDGYRVTIPEEAVTDCESHKLEIVVRGEAASRRFVRCDTTPEPFMFDESSDVAVDTMVVSEPAIITGIDAAVGVKVSGGEYSIDCSATFTSEPGTFQPGQSICVRHRTALESGQRTSTWLHVGGESARFTSTTR